MIELLFSDKDIIVCKKPCGVLSQKDAMGQEGLPEILSEQLNIKTVYPVHRLDRPVGGVMVFAKTKTAAAALSGEGAFEKTYLALVTGMKDDFPLAGEMVDYLYKDGAKGKSFVVKSDRKGAKQARLAYRVLESAETEWGRLTLVRVRLFTGRTHQIRVQFASRGMSLAGDGKYGSRIKSESIALWSYMIAMKHPVTKKTQVFYSCPENNGVWGAFALKEILKEET